MRSTNVDDETLTGTCSETVNIVYLTALRNAEHEKSNAPAILVIQKDSYLDLHPWHIKTIMLHHIFYPGHQSAFIIFTRGAAIHSLHFQDEGTNHVDICNAKAFTNLWWNGASSVYKAIDSRSLDLVSGSWKALLSSSASESSKACQGKYSWAESSGMD